MRDNNPIEVTNLPAGLRYANNQITGTPTAGVGYYTVTIKAYDKTIVQLQNKLELQFKIKHLSTIQQEKP